MAKRVKKSQRYMVQHAFAAQHKDGKTGKVWITRENQHEIGDILSQADITAAVKEGNIVDTQEGDTEPDTTVAPNTLQEQERDEARE